MKGMVLESVSAWYLGLPVWTLAVISIWSVVWKGFALWKAAVHKKNVIWFIVLLVVNTLGLLEILYIFWLSKIKLKKRGEKAGWKIAKDKKVVKKRKR